MTARPTSAQALATVEASGKLKGRRYEVLCAFREHGPGTSAEVLRAAALAGNLNLMRARVTEIADAGYLREGKPRKCRVTGHRAIVFEFAPCDPRPKKPTYRELEQTSRDLAWSLLEATRALLVDVGLKRFAFTLAEREVLDEAVAWKAQAEAAGAA